MMRLVVYCIADCGLLVVRRFGTFRPRLSVAVDRHGGSNGGYNQFVHGRSHMTIDPRIPTMPGWSTSGFHQPGTGIACTKRKAP